MKVTEVYLQKDCYNPVCKAIIPGAWIAVIEDEDGIPMDIPVCRPHEAKDEKGVWKLAEKRYCQ